MQGSVSKRSKWKKTLVAFALAATTLLSTVITPNVVSAETVESSVAGVVLEENGQELEIGNELHFLITTESGLSSARIELEHTDGGHGAIHSLSIGDWDKVDGVGYQIDISVPSRGGTWNVVLIELYDENGDYLCKVENIGTFDIKEVVISGELSLSMDSVVLSEASDSVEVDVSLSVDCSGISGDYDSAYVSFYTYSDSGYINNYDSCKEITLSLDESTMLYSGTFLLDKNVIPGLYKPYEIRLQGYQDGNYVSYIVTEYPEVSLTYENSYYDSKAPNITGVTMNIEEGAYVDEDSTITFTVTAEDNGELSDSATIRLESALGEYILHNNYGITLSHQGNGVYAGTIKASELYASEWYIKTVSVSDLAGNEGYIHWKNEDEWPYYFYVEKDGVCNTIVYEQIPINFYNADGEIVASYTKDLPNRFTLEELLGDAYPSVDADDKLGAFLGWEPKENTVWDDRVIYTTDTEIVLAKEGLVNTSTSQIEFKAVYEYEDWTYPTIVSIDMGVDCGAYIDDDNAVTFTIVAEDNGKLVKDNASLTLESFSVDTRHTIPLTYLGNGIYQGTIDTAQLDACTWYVSFIEIYDYAGLGTIESILRHSIVVTNYFHVVRDGVSNENNLEQVTLNFYNAKNELFASYVKDIPQIGSLEQVLGNDLPVLETDMNLGDFQKWSSYDELTNYKNDKTIYWIYDSTITEIDFYPIFEKYEAKFNMYYLEEDGSVESFVQTAYLPQGADYIEYAKDNIVPPENDSAYEFQGWDYWFNRYPSYIGGVCTYSFGAVYDQYPVTVNKVYIDENEEVKVVRETKNYPAGTTYQEIVNAYTEVDSDVSNTSTITGWRDLLYGYAYHEGVGDSATVDITYSFDWRGISEVYLLAEYEDKQLISVVPHYLDESGNTTYEKYFTTVSLDDLNSEEVVQEKVIDFVNGKISHYPEMQLQNWETYFDYPWLSSPSEESKLIEVYLSALYDKKMVKAYNWLNKNESQIIGCFDLGSTFTLPETINGEAVKWVYFDGDELVNLQCTVSNYADYYPDSYYYVYLQDDILGQIESAESGETVEVVSQDTSVLEKEVLEALREKDVTLVLTIDGATYSINGADIPDGEVSDIDLSVVKTSKENGNISAETIAALAGNRQAEQLVFNENGAFGFETELTLPMSSGIEAEKAVLLQQTQAGLVYQDSALVEGGIATLSVEETANRTITFGLEQKSDSVIVYGTNGDINADGTVSIKDTLQLLHQISNRASLNEVEKGFADVDLNNSVNIQDLMRELHYVSGRSESLYEVN